MLFFFGELVVLIVGVAGAWSDEGVDRNLRVAARYTEDSPMFYAVCRFGRCFVHSTLPQGMFGKRGETPPLPRNCDVHAAGLRFFKGVPR